MSTQEKQRNSEGRLQSTRSMKKKQVRSHQKPEDSDVQLKVKELHNEILNGLGKMYASGGEFTEKIDKAADIDSFRFDEFPLREEYPFSKGFFKKNI